MFVCCRSVQVYPCKEIFILNIWIHWRAPMSPLLGLCKVWSRPSQEKCSWLSTIHIMFSAAFVKLQKLGKRRVKLQWWRCLRYEHNDALVTPFPIWKKTASWDPQGTHFYKVEGLIWPFPLRLSCSPPHFRSQFGDNVRGWGENHEVWWGTLDPTPCLFLSACVHFVPVERNFPQPFPCSTTHSSK